MSGADPRWLALARGEVGQREVRGGENPRIVAYHRTTTLRATDDETPWCSSFVNWCLRGAGWQGTDSAAAASWLAWGQRLAAPRVGAVCVLQRLDGGPDASTGSGSGNHVGFFLAGDDASVTLLGGNQGDAVSVARFARRTWRVRGLRWPLIALPAKP